MRRALTLGSLMLCGLACGPPAGPADLDAKLEAKRVAELAGHRFWRVKLTAEDARKMAQTVCDEPRSSVVVIDDRGKVTVVKDVVWSALQGMNRNERWGFVQQELAEKVPAGPGERRVVLVLFDSFGSRPGLSAALGVIRAAVDARDYDD